MRRLNIDEANGVYMGMFVSVDSPLFPPNQNKKIVRYVAPLSLPLNDRFRGVNGPSVFRVTETDTGSTLEWIMKTDLRGGLPKRLVQSSMVTYFCDHMEKLRRHLESLSSA